VTPILTSVCLECLQLASLKLKTGRNRVTYRIGAAVDLSAYIYLLRYLCQEDP